MGASLPITFPTGVTGWNGVRYLCYEPVWEDELTGLPLDRLAGAVRLQPPSRYSQWCSHQRSNATLPQCSGRPGRRSLTRGSGSA